MKKVFFVLSLLMIFSFVLSACGPAVAETGNTSDAGEASNAGDAEDTGDTEETGDAEETEAESSAADGEDSKYGGTFIWGTQQDAPGLNPIFTNKHTDLYVYGLTMDPLTYNGENYPPIEQGILAESWEQSEDGLTWTIHLREGVLWHNGVEFTADDVLFWADAIQDPETNADTFSDRFFVDGEPYLFEKVDDYTVTVTTAVPVPTLMSLIVVPMIPKSFFEENNISKADMFNSISYTEGTPGTGPFQISEWVHGESITMERFDEGWRGKPYLDSVVLQVIPDAQTRLVALQTGEIHFVQIQPQDVSKLLAEPNITVRPFIMDSIRYIAVNNKKPMLMDKRTRQAMMYALDREAILETTELGYATPIDCPFTPYVSAYMPMEPYNYNPEKAQELLAEVGWVPGADGILVAETVEGVEPGTRFSIEFSLTNDDSQAVTTLVQAYLLEVGIEAIQVNQDSMTFYSENRNTEDKTFDLHDEDFGFLGANAGSYTWSYGSGDAALSTFSYDNQEVYDLFQQAKAAATQEEADELYKQAAEIIWDEVPILWLWYQEWIFAWNNDLHVEEANIHPSMYSLFTNPEKIWLEK